MSNDRERDPLRKFSLGLVLESVFWPQLPDLEVVPHEPSFVEFVLLVLGLWRGLAGSSVLILIVGLYVVKYSEAAVVLLWVSGGVALSSLIAASYRAWAHERRRAVALIPGRDCINAVRLHAVKFVLGYGHSQPPCRPIRGFLRVWASSSGEAVNMTSFQLWVKEDDEGGAQASIEQPIPLLGDQRAFDVWPIDYISMPQKGECWAPGYDPVYVGGDGERVYFWLAFETDWFPIRGEDDRGIFLGNASLLIRAQDADSEFHGWRTRIVLTERTDITQPARLPMMDLQTATLYTIKPSQNTQVDTDW